VSADPRMTTYVLLGLNVACFLLILLTGWSNSPWVNWLGLSPLRSSYIADGRWQTVPGVAEGAVWQLLSSVFTHQQWMHLGMNMLTLWFLGPTLERIFGRARFLALYLLSGLTASVVVLWLSDPYSLTLGASGALFGLIGGLIVVLHRLRQDLRQILLWLGLNVVFTLVFPNISWQGHLGGLVGGTAIAALLVYLPPTQRSRRQWLCLAGYTIVLAGLTVARCRLLA